MLSVHMHFGDTKQIENLIHSLICNMWLAIWLQSIFMIILVDLKYLSILL